MKKTEKKPSWRDVKQILADKSNSELLKLIADLYSASADNKSFIHARYSDGESGIEPYKKIIADAMYPDVYSRKKLELSVGKKAITDYFKATKDELGKLELMTHYLESGNQFTVDFGDIDEGFYASLESMFANILTLLKKQTPEVQALYLKRLRLVVSSAKHMGWWYYDVISSLLTEYTIDNNVT